MNLLMREKPPPPSAFAATLELAEYPQSYFRLLGYVDGKPIAKAFGDFRAYGAFRLIRIDVCEDDCCRRKGYATVMINKLMEEAINNGCNEFIFVGVSISNEAAIRLYSRLGAVARPIPGCLNKVDYVCDLGEFPDCLET